MVQWANENKAIQKVSCSHEAHYCGPGVQWKYIKHIFYFLLKTNSSYYSGPLVQWSNENKTKQKILPFLKLTTVVQWSNENISNILFTFCWKQIQVTTVVQWSSGLLKIKRNKNFFPSWSLLQWSSGPMKIWKKFNSLLKIKLRGVDTYTNLLQWSSGPRETNLKPIWSFSEK